jgi:hypothetical protein
MKKAKAELHKEFDYSQKLAFNMANNFPSLFPRSQEN